VDVHVKEPHLGVGDLRERLPVDAHELQERDGRQPGGEHRRGVAQQLHVARRDVLDGGGRQAHRREDPLDELGLEPRLAHGVLERARRVERWEQLLEVAERQAPALGGGPDRVQGVPARAHA
jgi:hypothetical protein